MAGMQAMEDNTHSLIRSEQSCYTNDPRNSSHCSPPPKAIAESEQDGNHQSGKDGARSKAASEEYSRSISIADAPSDKVRVSLVAKRIFNGLLKGIEDIRMGCVRNSVKGCYTIAGGNVEFAGTTLGDVNGDHPSYLLTEWVNTNYCFAIMLANN